MKIPLIKPYLPKGTVEAVTAVLESGYLTEGPITSEFESKAAEYLNCKHTIAVTSCTTGLELALRALGIGAGDEVIVPDYTYPATASAVAIVGATPVIVDIDRNTMNICYDAVESAITENTKVIMPVSLFGNPLDYNRLNKIKLRCNLLIIEDAACSFGAEYNGEKIGNQADITVFSCHPRKFLTTGEGGIVATNNSDWAEWMNSYKHFGMNMSPAVRGDVSFEIIGTNYKLSNILAAVGLEQLKIVDELLTRRQELAGNYLKLLDEVNAELFGVKLPTIVKGSVHSYQTFCVFVDNRDEIMKAMRKKGIEAQIGTYSLHMHKAFEVYLDTQAKYTNSSYAFEHCLALPLYHEMTMEEQVYVIETLVGLL